ncbi:DUF2946 family protein [Variovorax sp. PCZ-1]|uniref:DUF2946 family protein n=1 Tax=Variovorax sp. PCZ-1 TaxID=2835533 RepID=UPI001BCA82F1|nr:DUF2946 family protein [Variovorax sp. PCZ-1]MBS7808002.1 DUF2946 family protein [Variovorax sp. PCZ-1]
MLKNSHTAFAWLRSALLRRAVTWSFLLAIGFAHASPLLKPQSMELLCSSSGAMKLLIKSADGSAQESTHTVHCGLCALGTSGDGLPPPPTSHLPLAEFAQAAPQTQLHISIAHTAPPLPARGPPSLLS